MMTPGAWDSFDSRGFGEAKTWTECGTQRPSQAASILENVLIQWSLSLSCAIRILAESPGSGTVALEKRSFAAFKAFS